MGLLSPTPGDMTNPIGPRWLEDMWRDVTALGSVAVLGLVTLACAGYLLVAAKIACWPSWRSRWWAA